MALGSLTTFSQPSPHLGPMEALSDCLSPEAQGLSTPKGSARPLQLSSVVSLLTCLGDRPREGSIRKPGLTSAPLRPSLVMWGITVRCAHQGEGRADEVDAREG